MEQGVYYKSRAAFRMWLLKNHGSSEPVWIEIYKDGTESINFNEALEEALCFGWIDSMTRRVDERKYIQKFSKRKKRSTWSERNKAIAEDLIRRKLMTEYGLQSINEAKENGQWDKDTRLKPADSAGAGNK